MTKRKRTKSGRFKDSHGHAHLYAHGTGTRTYQTWCRMRQRCLNPNREHFLCYGGAGIRVCKRWSDSFEAFLKDMGTRPKGNFSLGRFGDVGNYSCGRCAQCKQNGWRLNCEWQTKLQQGAEVRGKLAAMLLHAIHIDLAVARRGRKAV